MQDSEQMKQWLAAQQPKMLDTLKTWSNINSGSFNIDGINVMAKTISQYAQQQLDCSADLTKLDPISVIDDAGQSIEKAIGPVLKLSKRPELKKRILFCGHMDTVFPIDSQFQKTQDLNATTLGGPGVADMKGGILVMLNAIQAFEQLPESQEIGWDILLNSDEEIGSLGSAPLLTEAAKKAHIGLVYEPCMPDGYLAGARRGSGNYSLVVHGKAAHAGREYHLGDNAIACLAGAMTQLDQLNQLRDCITLNLARINGGGPNNVVPDLAICHFNIRVSTLEDQAFAQAHVNSVLNAVNAQAGFKAELSGGFNRPPKPDTEEQRKLFELVKSCGQELNLELGFRPTGGCCDGNNLLAAGLNNIDTLGVQGGDIHSDKEYMLIDSLYERSCLSAVILQRLSQHSDQYLV